MFEEQAELIIIEMQENMQKTVDNLKKELAAVRTGRANPALLDSIFIDYYGVKTPLKQISSISIVEGTQLLIKPFDKSVLKQIEYAINSSDLGLTPQSDNLGIRLNLPALTGQRRIEISKKVEKICEDAKIAIRNIRRNTNDEIKKCEFPEDFKKHKLDEVQNETDKYIKILDQISNEKINEVQNL